MQSKFSSPKENQQKHRENQKITEDTIQKKFSHVLSRICAVMYYYVLKKPQSYAPNKFGA
jgi:hypothetical protein